MTVALGNLAADGIRKAATELKNFTTDVIETGTEFDAGISTTLYFNLYILMHQGIQN